MCSCYCCDSIGSLWFGLDICISLLVPPVSSSHLFQHHSHSCKCSSLLGVVTPVFQALVALAIRVLLRLVLLRKMPLAVCYHLAHVVNVFLFILVRVLLRIVLQYSNDFTTRIMADCLAGAVVFGPVGVLEGMHVIRFATSALHSLQAGLTSRLQRIRRCQASLVVRLPTC